MAERTTGMEPQDHVLVLDSETDFEDPMANGLLNFGGTEAKKEEDIHFSP
jgi:hypothetical protein